MVVREVLEVLYSPVNAFRKIIEKPDVRGVLLVLILTISSTLILEYVYSSKQLYENRMPENDDWTETLTNQHNWTSNGLLSLDGTDYRMGNTDGNHSIASSISNASSIWMKITGIGPLDCSEETGYKELFFWINWTNEERLLPSSATLKLFSGSEDSYFESNISNLASSGKWTNTTLKVGSDQSWVSNNSPNWQSISGIESRLDWSASANLTMKIDGLFFRKFVSPIETAGSSGAIFLLLISVIISVGMNWILWAGILLIVAKIFGEEVGPWKVFFLIIGFTFMATVVYTLATALAFSTLPTLNLPLEPNNQIAVFSEFWLPSLAYQVGTALLWIGEVWIAILGAIVVRTMKETTWGRAATIAAVAFGIRVLLRLFLGF